jgi:hypothetical protein
MWVYGVLVLAVLAGRASQVLAMTDVELLSLRDGFDARAAELFHEHLANDLIDRPVDIETARASGGPQRFVFSRLMLALSGMSLNEQVEEANAAVLEAIDVIRWAFPSVDEYELHWTGPWFYRLYAMFGPRGTVSPNRLSAEASEAIYQMFTEYARTQSPIDQAAAERVWIIWGSENHSAMRDGTCWAAARMLTEDPRGADFVYADGSTSAAQLAAWTAFLKLYYRERVAKGMLIEVGAIGYGSRTLASWYNLIDFADGELRELARAAMDVWWADWATLQLNGQRGGAKSRIYPSPDNDPLYGNHDRNRMMAWFYLGRWRNNSATHEAILPTATSTYRLPLVLMDIALDSEGRGVYEAVSRRPGRMLSRELSEKLRVDKNPIYVADGDYGAILHYTYCTPEFIMGTAMFPAWPHEGWTDISMQNRWHGVMFAGDDRERYILPQVLGDKAAYNAHWAVQRKGTMICQKLRPGHSAMASEMRVGFSKGLEITEHEKTIFVEAPGAFAAVQVVRGGWEWINDMWIRCNDDRTPVIIEVARKADFEEDFEAFKAAVLGLQLDVDAEGTVYYNGLSGDEFTFYAGDDRLPQINGETIDLAPDYTFSSPLLNEVWASGLVTITKDGRELTVDVRENHPVRNSRDQ